MNNEDIYMSESLEDIFDPSSLSDIDEDSPILGTKFMSFSKNKSSATFLVDKDLATELLLKDFESDSSFIISTMDIIFTLSSEALEIQRELSTDQFLITARVVSIKQDS